MLLDTLVLELDTLFSLQDWEADPAMSRWVPRLYQAIDYDYTEILEADFCRRFNGLMLRAGDAIAEVYCAAFPSPDILEQLFDRRCGEVLLFLHHPVDMEVGGVGFLPIPPADLERLRARGTSIYSCHAPLDCHDEIGTNASIVEALGMQVVQDFARYGIGFAGRVGSIPPMDLESLILHGKGIFGVERVEIGGARPEVIARVAVVAGGGDDPELLAEAEGLGAQAYLTGEWYTRTVPRGEEARAWAEGNRAACQSYAEQSGMALLGFSHAASEYLVMKTQMTQFFERRGLPVTCLEQVDWWR